MCFHTLLAKRHSIPPCVKMCIHVHVLHCAGDASAASSLDEKVINDRVELFVDMEDPDVVLDLRALNSAQKRK